MAFVLSPFTANAFSEMSSSVIPSKLTTTSTEGVGAA